ncbi:hypothetical protein HD554DRAFT_2206865 [Boletus coccyginus]|nr:hypothetical protein HD554DRAFT_2206865 [Boletus coccyginus]
MASDRSWHFGALSMTTKHLEEFYMGACAPELSSLLGVLLDGKEGCSKKTVVFSILMQSINQKANPLQSILGIFFQSAHTPQKVIDTLACIGISISTETINALGQSLLTSYAYDNFDVDLKSHVPTTEKSNNFLKHLTSGLLFPLGHGTTTNDLKCSDQLWKISALNLCSSASQLSRYYFHQFKARITELEAVKQIPLVKTEIIAARAMDVNNSTQGGIYDPTCSAAEDLDTPDISQHVILIHGDLRTGERLQTAQLQHSIEGTAWDRLQHILFIPGLFHMKMACAEAIWRCFLQPPAVREDKTSLIHDVTLLRPKETGIFCSTPRFRRMHQLIRHAGTCRQLDCWRVHIKNKGFASLGAFASSEPTFKDLQAIAYELTQTYVADYWLCYMKQRLVIEHDIQFENAALMNRYFLLYEELSYAMNRGDIGRTETCIVHWVPILKAIGKHKYATQMMNFLINIHFVYPLGFRYAVQYHWLVNPTGKPMKWHAVDWCVELNNLFTKVKNGGMGPNRTVEQIILESPLMQAYRNAQAMIQKNFWHTHLTTKHGDPKMTKTFAGLTTRLEVYSPHTIIDMVEKERELMEKAGRGRSMRMNRHNMDGRGQNTAAIRKVEMNRFYCVGRE